MNDELNSLDDAKLSEVFAVEVVGMEKRAEGMLWDESNHRAFIIAGSVLHDVRKRMRLPCDNGILAEFATDANALIPYLSKHHCSIRNNASGGWQVSLLGGFYNMKVLGASTEPFLTFARAACLALIRSARRAKLESEI